MFVSQGEKPAVVRCIVYSLDAFLPIIKLNTEDWLVLRNANSMFGYALIVLTIVGHVLVPLWTVALAGLIK